MSTDFFIAGYAAFRPNGEPKLAHSQQTGSYYQSAWKEFCKGWSAARLDHHEKLSKACKRWVEARR